jgi:hypothetical protein
VDKGVEAYIEDASLCKTFRYWKDITVRIINTLDLYACSANLGGRAVYGVGLSETGRSLAKRSPPSVVCMSMIVKPRQWGGAAPLGAVVPWKILYLLAVYFKLNLEVFKDWRWFIVSPACPKCYTFWSNKHAYRHYITLVSYYQGMIWLPKLVWNWQL